MHLPALALDIDVILELIFEVLTGTAVGRAQMANFENEFKDHIYIQRQGGEMQLYDTYLYTTTWYTGPGILLSKQVFAGNVIYELIANTPVDDGQTKCWHGCLYKGSAEVATEEDKAAGKAAQAGALEAFGADFNVWQYKRPALKIMQLKTDGPFRTGRKWYSQFFATPEDAKDVQGEINGVHYTLDMAKPEYANHNIDDGLPF